VARNVIKFQTGKYDKLYLGLFNEEIAPKIKFTSTKIAFRNTLITDIERFLEKTQFLLLKYVCHITGWEIIKN
jgi:hypothetical protein